MQAGHGYRRTGIGATRAGAARSRAGPPLQLRPVSIRDSKYMHPIWHAQLSCILNKTQEKHRPLGSQKVRKLVRGM